MDPTYFCIPDLDESDYAKRMRPSETAASRYGLQPQPPLETPPLLKPDPGVTSAREADFCRKYKDNWSVIVKEKWQRRLDHLRRELVVNEIKMIIRPLVFRGENLGCIIIAEFHEKNG